MSNESTDLQVISSLLPVNYQAVQELQKQRELLAKFVESQLRAADFSDSRSASYGEGDYGIIPGTKKNCLFKQGAEKLLRLFGLGVRFRQVDKEIDHNANFALYTYRAEVYVLSTGINVSECEATANSREVKYKERTEWKTNKNGAREATKVETPIYDVLNTLQKMAQKRALVGATLLATGASEYFTQDMLEPEDIEEAKPEPKPTSQPAQASTVLEQTPECCGKQMIISKYVDKDFGHAPFYCMNCKSKKPREVAA